MLAGPRGATLAAKSYPDRTSPVLRGKWLLDNIFGMSPLPPPPGVSNTLPENKRGARPASIRERLEQHRKSPAWEYSPVGVTHEPHATKTGYYFIEWRG